MFIIEIMKLLYAEDERNMAEAVYDILVYNNYVVDVVYDGEDALECALHNDYDGIILDIMMPKKSGLEVLSELRQAEVTTPVLLLTARGGTDDKILGLDMGADDYLAKPFAMGELIARVRAMLRRRDEYTPSSLTFKDLTLNMLTYELECGGRTAYLTKNEYLIMELLLMNKDIYLSSETIFIRIWGYDSDAEIGIVWVYISYIRKYLKQLGTSVELKAKRSIGYRLE